MTFRLVKRPLDAISAELSASQSTLTAARAAAITEFDSASDTKLGVTIKDANNKPVMTYDGQGWIHHYGDL